MKENKTPRLNTYFLNKRDGSIWQVCRCPEFRKCKAEQKVLGKHFDQRCIRLCKGKEIRQKNKTNDPLYCDACVGSSYFETMQKVKITKLEALLRCL